MAQQNNKIQQPNRRAVRLINEMPLHGTDALFSLVGSDGNGRDALLPVSDALLSRHLLLLGARGTGKSHVMRHLLRNLRANLGDKDVLVVLDPLGGHGAQLMQAGDVVFADDARASDGLGEAQWNLFTELVESDRPAEDASALCDMLFGGRIRAAREPFYPTAARDLTFALILYLLRQEDPNLRNNRTLRG